MQGTIERYMRHTKDRRKEKQSSEQEIELCKQETADLMKKIELLEASKRKLLGIGLGNCCIEELQHIEQQLESSVSNIRARKTQVFKEQIEKLKEKERVLTTENAMLSEKCGTQPDKEASHPAAGWNSSSSMRESGSGITSEEVETQLFIGPPPSRR
ncbi:hypothetical protein SAY86_020990 [Trapa natans]|nr:hypothetical protein SAY86_020990 [Trapa natans]